MAYYDSQKPYDLTILYMEDAREWCEYLFDLFQPYDVHQNSEDITVFPTQEATLDAIETSQVRIIIISPTFLERCTNDLQRYVTGKSVVGLLCGVKRQELHSLDLRVPSYKQWELIEAQSDAKDLTQVTMKMLQDAMKEFDNEDVESEDVNSVYMPMTGNVIRKDEEEDLYVQGTQEDLYVQGTQEDLYVQGTQSDRIQDIYSYDDPQAVSVLPDRIHVQKQKKFYVSFSNDTLEKGSSYLIKVTGEVGCTHTEGIAQNPYVLCVNTPEDIGPGPITMEITSQGQTLATCAATLVTPMDEVAENLKNSLEPMNFICKSLGISPASSNDLDNLLFDHIRKFQESSMLKNALTSSQEGKKTKSDKLYPTAVHFAAKFGLKTITNYLLGLPGADHALKVKNRDNHTPSDLAKRNGHEDLSDMMSYPTESPTSVSTNQGYVKMMTATPRYQTPRPADKDELHRMLDSGNIYDVFYPKQMTRIDEQDHSKNYEPVESETPIDGPALPNPITPTLPPHVTQPTSEVPDSQKELWDIDQRMKNGEITQQEAHQEFENWRVKYLAPPSKPSAPLPAQKPTNERPKRGPFGLRARQAPGASQDVSSVQPPPTRRQPDHPPPARQRIPPSPGTNDDRTTRRRSSGRNRLSYTDMSDYQPPSRDPPPIPSNSQQRPPARPRRPIPAPRP